MTKVTKGQIFDCQWGYEQTNVDFYEAMNDAPVGKMVTLRKIAKTTREEDSFMSGKTTPKPGQYIDDPFRRKVKGGWRGDSIWIDMNSYSGMSPWNGEPVRESWYA